MSHLLKTLSLASLTTILAACGGGGGDSSAGGGTTPPPVIEPPASTTCEGTVPNLVKRTVTVAGVTRDLWVAVPTNLLELRTSDIKGVATVVSFHNDGETPEQNAGKTCWNDLAQEEGFVAVFPAAVGGSWNTNLDASKADDIAFVKALLPSIKSAYSLGGLNNVYFTGKGAGSKMANAAAVLAPTIETLAAVAGVDGTADPVVYDVPAASRPSSTMASWILKSNALATDASETRQVAYWNAQNSVTSVGRQVAGATLSSTVYSNADRPLQQVRVSALPRGFGGKELSKEIWDGMFFGTYRFPDDTRTNGTLHPNKTIAQMKLLDTTKEFVIGSPRRWLTYLPSNYAALTAGGQRLPVVISLHGRNGSGKYQALITKWHEVAETNGFIAVYPQGLGATWGTSINNPNVDTEFIMSLIEELKVQHAVDPQRIFLNGTSMGAALTNRIAVQYPLTFAAIAPCYSGHLSPASYTNAIVRTDVPLPVWQCRGGDELPSEWPAGLAGEAAAQQFWRETVNRNTGIPQLQVDGRRATNIWTNGVAEYRWQITEHVGHFWHEGQSEKMWREMFSKYSRNGSGALVKAP